MPLHLIHNRAFTARVEFAGAAIFFKFAKRALTPVVNSLCVLTDGYDPKNPAIYRNQAQCLKAVAVSASN